jgi:hypothetical protein
MAVENIILTSSLDAEKILVGATMAEIKVEVDDGVPYDGASRA